MSQYLTPTQADEMAEKIRTICGVENEMYIDISNIATQLNCEVLEVEFEEGADISGMVSKEENIFQIQVNMNDVEPRKRFTIAHELAHVILHSQEIESGKKFISYRRSIGFYTDPQEIRNEIQANMLAASLLMPAKLVKQSWNDLQDIDEIASLFHVSKKAAFVRLESLGLI